MKTIVFFVFDGMELLDFAGPYEVFSAANQFIPSTGYSLRVLSPTGSSVKTINGVYIGAEDSWTIDVNPDVLVIAGGEGTKAFIGDPIQMKALQTLINKSNIVASICSGARILAHLNMLDHIAFTTHPLVAREVAEQSREGQYIPDKKCVKSGKIFTASAVSAGIDLALSLVDIYEGPEVAAKTKEYIGYSS
jgi:transcriptional regulator GlxA family with amidase domain